MDCRERNNHQTRSQYLLSEDLKRLESSATLESSTSGSTVRSSPAIDRELDNPVTEPRPEAAAKTATNNSSLGAIVIVPAYREPEGIRLTLDEIRAEVSGVKLLAVVRDDGDETLQLALERAPDTIVQVSTGKGKAFGEALRHMRNNGGPPSTLVLIDADGTYPAERINTMLRILNERPQVGMVLGNRFGEANGKAWSIFNAYYVGNRFLRLAHRALNGVRLKDPLTGLRAIRYSLIDGWEPDAEGFDLEAELNYRVVRLGGLIQEIPVTYRRRVGEKKLRIHHGFGILLRMLKCFAHGRTISGSS